MSRLLSLVISLVLFISYVYARDECCDNNQCATQKTCSGGQVCCYTRPVWMESIGGYCYDPAIETCASCPVYNPNHGMTTVCPKSTPTCCSGGCFDTTSTQCCHHYGSYLSFTCTAEETCCGFGGSGTCCSANQQCVNDQCVAKTTCPSGTMNCGQACYRDTEYTCIDQSTSKLCPVAYPSACGDACYSESQYTCESGALMPVQSGGSGTSAPTTATTTAPTTATTTAPTTATTTAPSNNCLPGDSSCGNRCYSPSTHVCADASSNFLCPVAYPNKCGGACYSSSQYTCVDGQLRGV